MITELFCWTEVCRLHGGNEGGERGLWLKRIPTGASVVQLKHAADSSAHTEQTHRSVLNTRLLALCVDSSQQMKQRARHL